MAYKTVGLPKVLYDRFEKIRRYFGYRTFSELVVDAARDKIRELELTVEVHTPIEVELKKDDL